MMTNYPGIQRIAYIMADKLPKNLMQQSIAGLVVAVAQQSKQIKFYGLPMLETDLQEENFGWWEEATLTLQTLEKLPTHKKLAFIIQDVNGNFFLLGTKENHPVFNISDSVGDMEDRNVYRYKITLKCKKALLRIAHVWLNDDL